MQQQQVKVVVTTPNAFGESKQMVLHIREGRPVIVNLEGLSRSISQRIVDYLSGATYILGGNMQKIGEFIFFFAPQGFNIGVEDIPQQYKSKPFPFE